MHTCTDHFAETLSHSSALGRRRGLRCGDDSVSPWDGTGSAGMVTVPSRPGLGLGHIPGRGAGAAPGSAGCTDEQLLAPGSDFWPLAIRRARRHRGDRVSLLGVRRETLFSFLLQFFFLFFSPPDLSAPHTFVGACPRPYQATVLSPPPRDKPSGVQARIAQGSCPHTWQSPVGA